MQVTTGKVNQLGLEKSYFENYSREDSSVDEPERVSRKPQDNRAKKHNHRDKRKPDGQKNHRKKSFFGSIFSAFSK
jgi:hypothetical protein